MNKSKKSGIARGLSATACAIAFALSCVGCSSGSHETENSNAGGARMASSLQELARQYLREDASMDAVQKEAVTRVAESGRASASDYEAAWSRYQQCMTDRGYRQIVLVDMRDGMKVEAPHSSGTTYQENRYRDDSADCTYRHLGSISTLYESQVGNRNLYSDRHEAAVDCLHGKQLVKQSYTVKDFKADLDKEEQSMVEGEEAWPYPFGKDSADAMTCLAVNGFTHVDLKTSPVEQLW